MTDNRQIQSVLAKAIMDVRYIDAIRHDEKGQAALLTDPAKPSVDAGLKGITNFSAFVAKVQHNFLWNDFPLTFRLMHQYQLEINIFTSYLQQHQQNKREGGLDGDEKIDRFIHFLKTHLKDRRSKKYRLLYHTLVHEDSIRQLRRQVKETIDLPESVMLPQSVVYVNGGFHLHSFPLPAEELASKKPSQNEPRFSRVKYVYAYWMNPARKLEVMTIGREARIVMNEINNMATVGEIVNKTGRKVGKKMTIDILSFLLQNKIVYLNRAA